MLKTKLCKHGVLTYLANDIWIGGGLDRHGEYSETEVQKLLSLLDKTSVVVEVGANIGAISVPLAKNVAELHCFEPQPEICKILSRNIEQNHLTAQIYQKAVGRVTGPVSLSALNYEMDKINTGGVSIQERGNLFIEQVRLDDFLTLERLDLLKVDVEGYESEIIAGAHRIIHKFHPVLYIENDREAKSADLIRQIMGLGYRLYWHFPPTFNPLPLDPDDIISINMLCVPEGQPVDMTDVMPIVDANAYWRVDYEKLQKSKQKPKLVVREKARWAAIYRAGGVGDNLIASSVLPGLKAKYGHVEVITGKPNHVVFENNPHVDKLTVQQEVFDPTKWKEFNEYWMRRAGEYDFFANLVHSVEVSGALFASQVQFHWPAKARRKFCGRSYLEIAADICDVPYETLAPDFFPDDLEIESALEVKKRIGPYVGWLLSGTRVDKIWPFAAIAIPRIIKELNLAVVLFGAQQRDFEAAKIIEQQTIQTNGSADGLHLACSSNTQFPHWPVRRLLTQVQQAEVVVTPDTGPAWACAMHSMPKVLMVSHASPENISKHWINTTTLHADPGRVPCWPCHLLLDDKETCERHSGRKNEPGAACISDISAEMVLQSIKRSLMVLPQTLAAE